MRITPTFLLTVVAFVSAQEQSFLEPNIFAEDFLDVTYSQDLACGACVRGGWTYCIDKKSDKMGRASGDVCCDGADCILEKLLDNKDIDCATTDTKYANHTEVYYKDKYVLLQKFCAKRQNATACCNSKHEKDECKLKLKYKGWDTVNITLDELPYGGSCTYKVEAKCGYPSFTVNNTNIDMVVAFKKEKWDDDSYDDDQNSTYSNDETYNPKSQNGKISFKMDKDEKHDKDDKDEKDCQKTKLSLTLTNLKQPTKTGTLAESRLLEAGSDSYAQLQFGAEVPEDNSMIMKSFSAILIVLSILQFF